MSVMSQGRVPGGGVVKLKKQIPSVECKFFDTTVTTLGTANVWVQLDSNTVLSGIAQGAGPSQRVGRKIKVVGFVVRMPFDVDSSPWTLDLVRDKQCNGVAATAAQIYIDPNQYGALPNPFEETRFVFLRRTESFNPALAKFGAGTISGQLVSYNVKTNFTVEYNNNGTGTVTDLTSDNVQLWGCSDGTITPVGKGFIRVLYTDA